MSAYYIVLDFCRMARKDSSQHELRRTSSVIHQTHGADEVPLTVYLMDGDALQVPMANSVSEAKRLVADKLSEIQGRYVPPGSNRASRVGRR